ASVRSDRSDSVIATRASVLLAWPSRARRAALLSGSGLALARADPVAGAMPTGSGLVRARAGPVAEARPDPVEEARPDPVAAAALVETFADAVNVAGDVDGQAIAFARSARPSSTSVAAGFVDASFQVMRLSAMSSAAMRPSHGGAGAASAALAGALAAEAVLAGAA